VQHQRPGDPGTIGGSDPDAVGTAEVGDGEGSCRNLDLPVALAEDAVPAQKHPERE
jgi:hypothetical protein